VQTVEPEGTASDPAASGAPASPREPRRFWRALAVAFAACTGSSWILDALPPAIGEPVLLRWLRALAEHPVRGPLGLALAWIGLVLAFKAAFRRSRA